MASCPGFTTPLGPAAAVQGGKRAVKCLGARASFWRKALAHWSRGRHAKAYLHMLLFHFHTLHANALWKVPSQFPPQRREGWGGGGKRLGRNGRFQPDSVSFSQRGRPQPPSCCWLGLDPWVGAGVPLPARPWEQTSARTCALWRLLSRMPCSAPASPEEVLVRRWVPGFLSVLSTAPRGNPKTFIRGPTSLMAFQVCAG